FSSSFLSSSAPHPHLPSFPTRRSSDLAHRAEPDHDHVPARHVAYPTSMQLAERNEWKLATVLPRADGPLAVAWYGILLLRGVLRSEEHTSELQSLAYLVCRLLLEKKKK